MSRAREARVGAPLVGKGHNTIYYSECILPVHLWFFTMKYILQVALRAKHNITQSPFAQIVYVPQSLVPGIWQNPLPLTGPAHSHTVDTNHKTMKSVNSIV